ncbi:MAG: MBL fold metallo-hydrolase [Oscillospiraceae bacterium]
MYELIQVSEHSYYVQSPAKIGIVELDAGEVVLIDSGSDKDAGRKLRQILEGKSWKLRAIYNTHSNADHIGGNKYLQNQYGCKIFAPGIEADFTRHPLLEPSFLYGGFPPKELRHKFLLAQESNAESLRDEDLPSGLQSLALPGHFFDMVGFKTGEGVVFLADCLSSEQSLNKYQISFVYDVAKYLETLETVKTMKAEIFVPAHAEATNNIAPLAQKNIEKVQEIGEKILELCREPIIFEKLLQGLFNDYALAMDFEQYVLVGSTVRSYLSWLKDGGKLEIIFENGQLLWKTLA